VGRIWDVRAGRFAAPRDLQAAVERARFVLLGETHDNPDHHVLQARLLQATLSNGRRPALAFEMLDLDQQAEVDAVLNGPDPTAGALRDAVGWDQSGWPPFALYQPIFQAGLGAHLPIVAANLSRRSARAVIHHGTSALDPRVRALLDRAGPLPTEEERDRRAEMETLHCGQLPEDFLGPMVLSQRARDAQLAQSLLSGATADGAVLVTGAEHARRDRGVGAFLLVAGVPPNQVVSVAFREVDPEVGKPAGYEPSPYDYLVFTPGAERADPCEGMRPDHTATAPPPSGSAFSARTPPPPGPAGAPRGSWSAPR
jgi:uncharacterized iron-regulated protein